MLVLLNTPSSRRFSFLRFFVESQANPSPDFLKRAESLDRSPYFEGLERWSLALRGLESVLSGRPYRVARKLPFGAEGLRRRTIQKLDQEYQDAFSFAHLCQAISRADPPKEGLKFILSAPREIRRAFVQQGLQISELLSSLLWFCSGAGILASAGSRALKRSGGSLLEFFRRARNKGVQPPQTAFVGLTPSDFTLENGLPRAIAFVHTSNLPPFRDAERVFVADPRVRGSGAGGAALGKASSGRNPFLYLHLAQRPLTELARQIKLQARLWLDSCLAAASGNWWELLLAEDCAELPRAFGWCRMARPRWVTMSFASFRDPPLWLQLCSVLKTEVWILFYCITGYPFVREGERPLSEVSPIQRFMTYDKYAVWDEEEKGYFLRYGVRAEQIFVGGPMVFSESHPIARKKGRVSKPVVGVFDILPFDTRFLISQLGWARDHNRLEVAIRFLEETLLASREALGHSSFEYVLKSKRASHVANDPAYFKFLEGFKNNREVTVLDPDTNLYALVDRCDLVISAPFTSVSRFSAGLGGPSCYYDATGTLLDLSKTRGTPPLIKDFSGLVRWIEDQTAL